MSFLEVIARAKVRPGQLDGFMAQAAEIVRLTRELDTHTLRCDWYLDADRTECEVHERFPDEKGLIEHSMNIMEARTILFRDFGSDHHSTLFGEVSQDFVDLVTQRMGAPTVFTFLHGLEDSATIQGVPTGRLEVIARLKVRPGQLDGFRAQTAEIVRLTRALDTHTARYDWFINADATECEVHEAYTAEEGLIEHNAHVVEAREVLFEQYAYDHRMSVYGTISDHLAGLFDKHAGGVALYSFVEGLQAAPAV